MNNYTIYMHRNKINNKIYIGQTCQKPEYRWNHGEGYTQCSAFYAAIQKYGWDNFEHIILFENLSQQEANQKEYELIQKYQSNNKQFGYNIQAGGKNHSFSEMGKEHCHQHMIKIWSDNLYKQNISNKMKEKWQDSDYREKVSKGLEKARKKHFEETGLKSFITEEGRQKISQSRKEYIIKYGTPTQGKGHSNETKEKIRQSQLGKNNSFYGHRHTEQTREKIAEKNYKKVRCIETNEIFDSIKLAAQWAGLKSSSGISDNIAGRKKSAGKHPITQEKLHWELII